MKRTVPTLLIFFVLTIASFGVLIGNVSSDTRQGGDGSLQYYLDNSMGRNIFKLFSQHKFQKNWWLTDEWPSSTGSNNVNIANLNSSFNSAGSAMTFTFPYQGYPLAGLTASYEAGITPCLNMTVNTNYVPGKVIHMEIRFDSNGDGSFETKALFNTYTTTWDPSQHDNTHNEEKLTYFSTGYSNGPPGNMNNGRIQIAFWRSDGISDNPGTAGDEDWLTLYCGAYSKWSWAALPFKWKEVDPKVIIGPDPDQDPDDWWVDYHYDPNPIHHNGFVTNESIELWGNLSYSPIQVELTDYYWDFGDPWAAGYDNEASGKVVQHKYTRPGVYYVQLWVTDANMRTGWCDHRIKVFEEPPQGTTGVLSGFVVDADGAIEGAAVVAVIYTETTELVTYNNLSAISTATGAFLIEDIALGSWDVMVELAGYEMQKKQLQFSEGMTTWWNLTLSKESPHITYSISGRVDPPDATITIKDDYSITQNTDTGDFTISGLPNGNHEIIFSKDGYNPYQMFVLIDGSDIMLQDVVLDEEESEVFEINLGPFMEGDNAVAGIDVSFTLDGVVHNKLTGADGNARFEIHRSLPTGTMIKASYHGELLGEWRWDSSDPPEFNVIIASKKVLPVPYSYQGETQWCWANSMAMVMQYYGKHVHPWEITSDLNMGHDAELSRFQIDRGLIDNYFGKHQLICNREKELTFNQIKQQIDSNNPQIFAGKPHGLNGHVIVITGYFETEEQQYFYVNDPGGYFIGNDVWGVEDISFPYINIKIPIDCILEMEYDYTYFWSIHGDPNYTSCTINLIGGSIGEICSSEPDNQLNYLWLDKGLTWRLPQTVLWPFNIPVIADDIPFHPTGKIRMEPWFFNSGSTPLNLKLKIKIIRESDNSVKKGNDSIVSIPAQGAYILNEYSLDFNSDISFYNEGWYSINMELWKNDTDTNNPNEIYDVIENIRFRISAQPYDYYMVQVDCPINATITDTTGLMIGFTDDGTYYNDFNENGHFTTIGDAKLFILPPNRNYNINVSGYANGTYDMTIISQKGNLLKIFALNSTVTASTRDTFWIDQNFTSIKLSTNEHSKKYSISITHVTNDGNESFLLANLPLTNAESHTYEILNWSDISSTTNASIQLGMDGDNDGNIDQTIFLHNDTQADEIANVIRISTTDIIIVDFSISNRFPITGETITLNVKISNPSPYDLNNISLIFYDNNNLIHKQEFNLSHGNIITISVKWVATVGNHSFSVVIDEEGLIDESNEDNNKGFLSVDVLEKEDTPEFIEENLLQITVGATICIVILIVLIILIKKRRRQRVQEEKKVREEMDEPSKDKGRISKGYGEVEGDDWDDGWYDDGGYDEIMENRNWYEYEEKSNDEYESENDDRDEDPWIEDENEEEENWWE